MCLPTLLSYLSLDKPFAPRPDQHYVERDFANIEFLAKKLEDSTSFNFRGPKGCGKSTTLVQLYHTIRNKKVPVFFIDMVMAIKVGILASSDTIVFIDNAQKLGDNYMAVTFQDMLSLMQNVDDMHLALLSFQALRML